MEKITPRDNLYQYFFNVEDDIKIINAFACIDGDRKKALLIDVPYPETAEMVKKDLENDGIQVETIILSHFHPDHVSGCPVFSGCAIYASQHYEENFENCQRWRPDLTFARPTHLLKEGESMVFGSFSFRFLESPGHSRCGLLTLINDDVLHIGDLMMFDGEYRPTIPYIAMGGGFKQHIDSLERIKRLEFDTMIIPHGPTLNDQNEITEHVDDRIYYLNRVLTSKGTLPLAVCLKKDISHYTHTQYHDTNLLQLMLEV
jgi:glyoxylase-like metal-dependent hydrolase (beta-lactamase superfamily II)